MATLVEKAVAVSGRVGPGRATFRLGALSVVAFAGRAVSPAYLRRMVPGKSARAAGLRDAPLAARQVVAGPLVRQLARAAGLLAVRQVVGAVVVKSLARAVGSGSSRQVLYAAVALACGRRVGVERGGLFVMGWPGVWSACSSSSRAAGVRVQAVVNGSLAVSGLLACGRFDRLLAGWSELPSPWAVIDIPEVGYVGTSLAALAVLRGAAVSWSSSDGTVRVGGQIVIGDSGAPVLAASDAAAGRLIVRASQALVKAIGISAGLAGGERQKQQEGVRAAHARRAKKAGARVGADDLSPEQSRALQAELKWRESRL